jgi:hypothetical protein
MRSSLARPQKRIALIHRYIFPELLWQNKEEALGKPFTLSMGPQIFGLTEFLR